MGKERRAVNPENYDYGFNRLIGIRYPDNITLAELLALFHQYRVPARVFYPASPH